ncbi:MAG TPA: hypothetical protein VNH22_04320 [Blastocatellia bacterium]|jgi:hypothetical protein|nr:hypothetical protein [Blastocatellia bacterium]
MKVCPNCNESFGDDLNFCDVDGTRLERHRDVASTGDRSRAWSFLGAGLLLGALALSAASIIFFPKPRAAPTVASSLPSSGTSSGQGAGEASATSTGPAQPEIVVEEAPAEEPPPAEVKKKDKLAGLMNGNANVSVPNPKAVALEADDAATSSKRAGEPLAPPPAEVKDPDPAPPRPVFEPRESEKEVKAAPVIDPKKDPKAKAKDSAKDGKKKDDGKDKKKGGFFGVFKKIFGKD